jgi:aerobic carbon-monoxide dehydrogenase medium subunit
VKPASFRYHVPASADEAVAVLAEQGDGAKALAGGQSLVPLLNMRLAAVSDLVDLNRCADLDSVRGLQIGALTRQRAVELSADVRRECPLLVDALRWVGHPPIRNRGTVGGSLVHADPAAELPAVAVALDAVLVLRGRAGEREVPAAEFFTGVFETAIAPDELLVAVRFPRQAPDARSCFLELARRHGDFAIAGVAAVLRVEEDRVTEVRLALAGVDATPVRAARAEAAALGEPPSPELFAHAAELAAGECSPSADLHGGADYRRQLVRVLVERALTACAEGGEPRRRALPRGGSGGAPTPDEAA